MKTYPLNLIGLAGRRVVVIGGGSVAARKIEGLIQGGAQPHVIALAANSHISAIAGEGSITLEERGYRPGDLTGAWLVIAATSNAAVNAAVAQEALAGGSLVNVVDDPGHSNFILPAVLRRGEVSIAVSTGGGSPALAQRLREDLESLLGNEIGALAGLLADLRAELLRSIPSGGARRAVVLRMIDDVGLRQLLAEGDITAARDRARTLMDQGQSDDVRTGD